MNLINKDWDAVKRANAHVASFKSTIEDYFLVGGQVISVDLMVDSCIARTNAAIENFLQNLAQYRAYEPNVDFWLRHNVDWVGNQPIPETFAQAAKDVHTEFTSLEFNLLEKREAIFSAKRIAEEGLLRDTETNIHEFYKVINSNEYKYLMQGYDVHTLQPLQEIAIEGIAAYSLLRPEHKVQHAQYVNEVIYQFTSEAEACLPQRDTA
ncbi:MAG: hypothetical protein JSS32_07320 [Verrucomicrobia bacterium]|nr:hypothetical protein [Verrucomicrobiota bacterium]